MADQTTTDVLPASNRDLLDATVIAHIATIRSDGFPQSNPVWFEWDGTRIKISQTKARQKMRNIEHDPHVALSFTDPENPYRYFEVRGVVDQVDDDPDQSFIDHLSERYLNQRPYPYHQEGDERIVVSIRPAGGSAMG